MDQQRRIMVVEDHAQTRELLQYNLQAAGYDVRAAGAGEQGLEVMLSPFFLACELFASERAFARRCLDRFGLSSERPSGLKMAHFTDTFAEVNGVARTIQQQIELAGKHGKDMAVSGAAAEILRLAGSS